MADFAVAHIKVALRFVCTGHIGEAELVAACRKTDSSAQRQRSSISMAKPIRKLSPWMNRSAPRPSPSSGQKRVEVPLTRQSQPQAKQLPLTVLFGSFAFAKQYEIPPLLKTLLNCFKKRLSDDSFEEIMGGAMKFDVSPLKMACLEFAKHNMSIKRRFDSKTLSAPVMFELCALWEEKRDESRATKRFRLT
eukprot:TRINITY_DN6592_c0_g1_i1.p1 TRINITY_DN6592_c0_g1~~TRINITY_DN6592_c0_g1_i1.p1  ORF type:complete len:192 (-),score=24.73 TRINITY_DN6592_c0_g1_i1:165-740(-)